MRPTRSNDSAKDRRRGTPTARLEATRLGEHALLEERERLGNRAFGAALQRTLSPPDDPLEREADRAAQRVLRMPQSALPRDPVARTGGAERVVHAPGQALDAATRAFMEPRFGRDLSGVRLHTDPAANRSARAVGAKAYTVGDDIVFGAGRFAPATGEGRRLLAHELAHVTQRSGRLQREPELKGAMRIPVQPSEFDRRSRIWGDWYHYNIRHDIQWHNSLGGWDLVIDEALEVRKKLSSLQVAYIAVRVLAAGVGLPMKSEGQALAEHIAEQIDTYGLADKETFVLNIPFDLIKSQFDEKAFEAYWADVKETYPDFERLYLLVACDDFGSGKESSKGDPEGSKRAKATKMEIDALLDKARKETPKPQDLPDQIVLWYNERDHNWYFNVWTYLDTAGKEKRGQAIKLDPGENAEELWEKVRAATGQALQAGEDRERSAQAKLAPAWARELERELRKRLDALRKEEDGDDFPDGMVLVPEPDVRLQIWVERGKTPTVQRSYGSVPLVYGARVDQLVPYVRHVAAMLRQYEQTPTGQERPKPAILLDDPQKLALGAFPAEIRPVDLRSDNITVTGAKNEFHMMMDYEAVYGGGELKDLAIASKLYQQYIHFYWEVYPVPADVPLPKGRKKAPESWERRRQWLYDSFNPPLDEQGYREPRAASVSGPSVTSTDSSDSSSRVKMPSTPGDYLVRCVTGHGAIGEHKLKRISSEAYYPVRVRPIEEVVKGAASQRLAAIAATEAELQGDKKLLDEVSLEQNEKEMLEAKQLVKGADLARMRKKETQTLSQNTEEEIAHATKMLEDAKQLDSLLGGILERAKAQGAEPSALLKERPEVKAKPELLTLYWYLISEGTTAQAYAKDLEEKITQLKGVQKRAGEFAADLKASSPYQYSAEAAFASEVTGQVYPLVLMVGEAPDSVKAAMIAAKGGFSLGDPSKGVAYAVVDVTSHQTQDVYYGYSEKSGSVGHREAIDAAFEKFGEEAVYGEGIIAARIPPGTAGEKDQNQPGTEIKTYTSAPGPIQKVLYVLGIIAAIVGVAALVATGVGAPVAAGILGAVAATAGAILALRNISKRQRSHTLELDAELVLDIVSIIAVVPAVAGARVAIRTAAGLRTAAITRTFLEIYALSELGATVILVPVKLAQDIQRIEEDPELSDEQKQLMIAEARLGAVQAGIMLLGGAVAAHVGGQRQAGGGFDENSTALRRQIELLELEGFGEYKSMQERGWVDATGNWTESAPEVVRSRAKPAPAEVIEQPKAGGEELTTGKPAEADVPAEQKSKAATEEPPAKPAETEAVPVEQPKPGAKETAAAKPAQPKVADMASIGADTDPVQILDAENFSKVKLKPGQDALYILRDADGTILKVGKTSAGGAKNRFSVYKRAGKLTGKQLQLEVHPLKPSAHNAEHFEGALRTKMKSEGNAMPWDNTGGRLGRPGFGTPGEGVRTPPITKGEMQKLLTAHNGDLRAVGKELRVHRRTVDLWAKALGLLPKDFK